MSAPSHFTERRHAWAIYDEDRGVLVGASSPAQTLLFRTRRSLLRSDAWKFLRRFNYLIVKVRITYEVIA